MPTTVKDVTITKTEKTTVRPRGFGINGNGHRSNGFRGGGGGGDDGRRDDAAHDRRPIRYKFGLVIGLVAITMTFGALAGAFVFRLATNHDWRPIKMPSILWASTALIVASSLTLEAARRAGAPPKGIAGAISASARRPVPRGGCGCSPPCPAHPQGAPW